MPRRLLGWTLRLLMLTATPVMLWWALLHLAATIGLAVFALFIWTATLPLHSDLRAARARRTARPRLVLADAQVDWEFQRIVDGEKSRES